MRVRSDLFVSAIVRRVFSTGGFAAVAKKGVEEAGAIFVRQRFRDGTETLYGPAPQSLMIEEDRDSRMFEVRLERADAAAIDEIVARERKWDPDLWVVELEIDAIGDLLPMAAA